MPIKTEASFARKPTGDAPGLLGVKITGLRAVEDFRNIHPGLVLDTSLSMAGKSIETVLKTVTGLINCLNIGDKITIVGFGSNPYTIFSAVTITADPLQKSAMIADLTRHLVADGETNLQDALLHIGAINQAGPPMDVLMLLSDGDVTGTGIKTATGLYSIVKSCFGATPMYTIGYRNGYNAELMEAFAKRSQGSHTFAENELAMPVVIGDMIGGLQSAVANELILTFHAAFMCREPDTIVGEPTLKIGTIIADKPMWVLFDVPLGLENSPLLLNYKEDGVTKTATFTPIDGQCDELEILEQENRCMVGVALKKVKEAMMRHKLDEARELLSACLTTISSSRMVDRPLTILMKAQLEESLEEVNRAMQNLRRGHVPAHLVNRMTSLGANYAAQRGVTQMADNTTPGVFSSPHQTRTSQAMASQYTRASCSSLPADPAGDEPASDSLSYTAPEVLLAMATSTSF